MVDVNELSEVEAAEKYGKWQSPCMSWDMLEGLIMKTFEEADQLVAHNTVEYQHRSNPQPKTPGCPRVATQPMHESSATGSDNSTRDIQELRIPQDNDEYWSVSSKAWSKLSEARKEVLSHVGRINETSDGREAPGGDCKKCAESGSDCMVYCESARKTHHPLGGVSACSRCRFRGLACSFDVAGKAATKKRKAGCSGTGPSVVKKTRLR